MKRFLQLFSEMAFVTIWIVNGVLLQQTSFFSALKMPKFGFSNPTIVTTGNSASSTITNLNYGSAIGTNLIWVNATGTYTTGTNMAITTLFQSNGRTILGDASSDNVTFTGRVNSNIIPSANVTYDLGSPTLAWNNLFVASVSTTNISINGKAISGAETIVLQNSPSSSITVVGSVAANYERSVKMNNFVYGVNYQNSTFAMINTSIPSAPTVAYTSSSVSSFPSPWAMATDGKYVFVSNLYSNSISAFSNQLVTSSQPQLVVQGTLGTTGTTAIVADGRYLYKLGTTGTIDVLDYSSFTNAQVSVQLSLGTGGTVGQMVKVGNFLYLVTVTSGNNFSIIDVTDPLHPKIASQTNVVNGWGIGVQNNRAFISTYLSNTIAVYDVSQPYSPTLIATANNADVYPANVLVAGPYLYLQNFNTQAGISVWDIFSSVTPTKIGTIGAGNYGYDEIIVDGQYTYMFNHLSGVNTFDINSVAGIQTQGLWAGTGRIAQLTVSDMATFNGGVVGQGYASFGGGLTAKGYSAFDQAKIDGVSSTNMIVTGTVSSTNNIFTFSTTTAGIYMTGLRENTNAIANVCVDSNGQVFKDSTLACLTSNPRAKDNLKPLEGLGLKQILSLKPMEWDWNVLASRTGHDFGFNAEQAAKVDERLIVRDENGDIKGFRYTEYVAALTKAIQEQQIEIDTLKEEINLLKK